MTDGFLSRWSQRKLDVRGGKPVAEPEIPPQAKPEISPLPTAPVAPMAASHPPQAQSETPPDLASPASPAPPALPTLQDVQSLTPESDFKPFMARGVAADVKNAAMKKLFADPHYNVMDRLDTYIDDYSISDPIPEAMLRQMTSAKFLKLFDEEEEKQENETVRQDTTTQPGEPDRGQHAALRDDANTPAPEVVAQSPPTLESPIDHDHTDLRLQPDHALAAQAAGRGPA